MRGICRYGPHIGWTAGTTVRHAGLDRQQCRYEWLQNESKSEWSAYAAGEIAQETL